MKRLLLITICAAVASTTLSGLAQAPDALAPSSVSPKQVGRPLDTLPMVEQLRSPRPNPVGDQPLIPDKTNLTITGIAIVKNRADVQVSGLPPNAGLQVHDIPFLNGPDFKAAVEPFLGRLLTENAIRDLEDQIILYCRNHGKLLVDVILVPEQNIENGGIQLWFLEGKVGKVTVRNDDRKWFRDSFILSQVRLRPSEAIDSTKLTEDLNWLNANPFRQVDVVFKPGGWPKPTPDDLGKTDVELQVQDRFPVRPYVGYEDSGTRFTGEDRLLAGFNWGNAFGLDHQFNYQYSTDIDFDLVKAHSASYLAPLPWRHNLLLYGSYVDGKADFGEDAGGTSSEATSWQVSARYSIPLPNLNKFRHEVSAGFDFKRSNNDLLAGGTNVLQTSDTDIAQLAVSYSGLMPDKWGQTSFGLEGFYSPGGLTKNNDDTDFNNLRQNAPADYFYARVNLQRITRLPGNFSWILRGWGQIASGRLLPSEELALGGYNTVRGYDERIVIGDNGWIINNELRTPPFKLHLLGLDDQIQALAFFDYGAEQVIDATPSDGTDPDKTLYSVGAGLRYAVSRYFSFRFDYGVPLTEEDLNEQRTRIHIGVLLSF